MENWQWAELLTRCSVRSGLTSLHVPFASLPGVAFSPGLGLRAGRREGPDQSRVCPGTYSSWDRMGWVCSPPFQGDEGGSQGAGLTSHGSFSALLVGVAGAGLSLPLAAAQGARLPSGPAGWCQPGLCRDRQGQQLLREESVWHLSCSSTACHCLLLGLKGEGSLHPDIAWSKGCRCCGVWSEGRGTAVLC